MNKPKTATLRSPSPPSELLDELTPGYYQAQVKLNGKAYSRCGRDKAELLAWLTAKLEELHGEYHHH